MKLHGRRARLPTRRAFLGGASLMVNLPFLEALLPRQARGATCAPPRRFVCYHVPNGVSMQNWVCTGPGGPDYKLSYTLQPVAAVREDVLVINGLHNEPAIPKPTGGSHGTGVAGLLTCTRYDKSGRQGLNLGISMDQVAARAIGACTKLPSLQLGMERRNGFSELGVPGTLHGSLSWMDKQPLPKIVDLVQAFDRLFQGTDPMLSAAEAERRRAVRKSVLDRVLEDGKALQARLGAADRARLEQYTTSVRALETRIDGAGFAAACNPRMPAAGGDYRAKLTAMHELMALALQCDVTRLITFQAGEGLSNQTMPWLGVGSTHQVTHTNAHDTIRKVDTWRVGEWVKFIQRLKEIPDADGKPLLHGTAVYFTSEVSDGGGHSNENRPTLIAGQLGGAIQTGRLLYAGAPLSGAPADASYGRHGTWATCNERSQDCSKQRPVADLYVTLLNGLGVPTSSFANSTGPLPLS